MENVISTRICKGCGECCKQSPFIELSKHEINSLERLTGLAPELFTNPKGSGVEEYFLQLNKDGACIFLNEENGGYSCGVYDARPEICKAFPSKPIQNEFCDQYAFC